MTFSSYKNHNTFKALVGISPDGAITFVSSLYPGCISDKELTRKSGILDLLEEGDSVMADTGFEIEEDLMLIGVRLNIRGGYRGGGGGGGGQRGLLTPPPKVSSIPRLKYSNRAVTLIKQSEY